MKKTYSLYTIGFALVLASGVLLTHPPTTALADSDCSTTCQYGSNIRVSGTTCSCKVNVGCTWTNEKGESFTQDCAKKNDDDLLIE